MKTLSFTTLPINAALKAASEFLKSELQWNAINETQSRYLSEFYDDKPDEFEFVKRKASKSIIDIVEFLSKNGFPNIHLDPLDPGEFAIAGVMDHLVNWEVAGRSSTLTGKDKNKYSAVDFSDGGWKVFTYSGHKHPVAVISTKSGDSVYLTFPKKEPQDTISGLFDIVKFAEAITNNKGHQRHYDHLIIPKLKYEGDVDVTWIVGMKTIDKNKNPWVIRKAIMKSRLKLNHLGARAQAAFAGVMAFSKGPSKRGKYLIFDRPFLIWFVHDKKVTYAAYITEEQWKDPGDNIFN